MTVVRAREFLNFLQVARKKTIFFQIALVDVQLYNVRHLLVVDIGTMSSKLGMVGADSFYQQKLSMRTHFDSCLR